MDNSTMENLLKMELARYIQKATRLLGVPRKVGGNQFRHGWATLGVLIDHNHTDVVDLKIALMHDYYEHKPADVQLDADQYEIIYLDDDGPEVSRVTLELTPQINETKEDYFSRLLHGGTKRAKIVKVADRITNLIDLNPIVFTDEKIRQKIEETKKWILPMAREVSPNMAREMEDIIKRIDNYLNRRKC